MRDLITRYYAVGSRAAALATLARLGLAAGDEFISRADITVDWIGPHYDPPATFDDDGQQITEGELAGTLMNVYADASQRDAIEAMDAVFTRRDPVTPIRQLAGPINNAEADDGGA